MYFLDVSIWYRDKEVQHLFPIMSNPTPDTVNRFYVCDARVLPLTAIDTFSRQKNGLCLDACNLLPIFVEGHFTIPFQSSFHAI